MATPKFAFLINPGSGSVNAVRIKYLHEAIKTHKIDGKVILTGTNIQSQSERLRKAGYQAVIAAGGDGTLRAVAAAIAGTPTAFGILPWGTFNHFAKDLGVPDDIEAIFEALITGDTRLVDVGEVNNEIFLNNAALGVYPQFVKDRERIQPKTGKVIAAIIASIQMIVTYRSFRLTLTIDDAQMKLNTPLVFIGNNDYQIDRLGLVARENIDRGELCVYTLNSSKRIDLARLAWRTSIGMARTMELFHQFNPVSLTVDSPRHRSLLVGLDGEVTRMKLPLAINLKTRSLKLINARSRSKS